MLQRVKRHLYLFAWQVSLVALLYLCLVYPPANFISKLYIDIFAVGRSDFKVYFFIGFVLVLVSMRHFPPARPRNWLALCNVSLAALLFGFGLYEFFTFGSLYFDAPARSYAQYRDSISGTSLYHIHNSKAVLSWLLGLFGVDTLEHYDSGAPYLYFYSRKLLAAHSILYVLFGFLSLWQLQAYARLPAPLYALLAITTFILLKVIPDGGMLYAESIAAFPLYAALQLMLWRKKPQDESWRAASAALFLLGLVTYGLFAWLSMHLGEVKELLHYTVLSAFLFIMPCIIGLADRRRYLQAAFAIVLCVALYGYGTYSKLYYSYGAKQLDMISQTIDGHFSLFVNSRELEFIRAHPQPHIRINKIRKVGSRAVVEAEAMSPFRTWKLAEYWGLSLLDDTIKIDGFNCSVKIPWDMMGYLYVLESREPMRPMRLSYQGMYLAIYADRQQQQGKPFRSIYKMYLPPCSPASVSLLAAILNDVGITKSVFTLEPFYLSGSR